MLNAWIQLGNINHINNAIFTYRIQYFYMLQENILEKVGRGENDIAEFMFAKRKMEKKTHLITGQYVSKSRTHNFPLGF